MADYQYKIINGTKETLLLTITESDGEKKREKVTEGETQVLKGIGKDARVQVKHKEPIKKEGTIIIQFSPEVGQSQFEFEFTNKSIPGESKPLVRGND